MLRLTGAGLKGSEGLAMELGRLMAPGWCAGTLAQVVRDNEMKLTVGCALEAKFMIVQYYSDASIVFFDLSSWTPIAAFYSSVHVFLATIKRCLN